MKISLVTLGCPKNQVDSERLLGRLRAAGHEPVGEEEAEAILVNTCSFIEPAKAESIETILSAAATGRRVIVLGCLAERYREDLVREMPEVEAFFGVGKESDILSFLGGGHSAPDDERVDRVALSSPHSAYLKIAEGCDNRCTYCVIPSIRGPYRSDPPEKIIAEAGRLIEAGARELILVAQDTTAYGQDIGTCLEELLEKISSLPVPWIRVMYAYPERITDRLLDVMRERENICAYLDIPLQHASRTVLKRMGRRWIDPRGLLDRIRGRLPGAVLRSSFIVGFPGETEEEIEELLSFVSDAGLDRLGGFAYSREEGTPAARMKGQIGKRRKQERLDSLMALAASLSYARNREKIGGTCEVMIDESTDGVSVGRTRGDAPEVDGSVIVRSVFSPGCSPAFSPGEIVKIRITDAQDYDLVGVPADVSDVNAGVGVAEGTRKGMKRKREGIR